MSEGRYTRQKLQQKVESDKAMAASNEEMSQLLKAKDTPAWAKVLLRETSSLRTEVAGVSEKLKGLDEKYDSVLKTVQGVAKDQKTTSTELGKVEVRVKALEEKDNTDDVRKLRTDLDELSEKYERLLLRFEGTETKAREENQTLTDKLIAAEQRISDFEDKDNTVEVKALRKELETLKHVSSDIIGRSKRSNVRVINVKEGSEAGDIYRFLDELLRYVLDLGEGAEGPEINRSQTTA